MIFLSSLVWLNAAQFGAFIFIMVCMRFQNTTLKMVPDTARIRWKALPNQDRFEVGGGNEDIEMKPPSSRRPSRRVPRKLKQELDLEEALAGIEAAAAMGAPELPTNPPPQHPAVDELRHEVESDLNEEQ